MEHFIHNAHGVSRVEMWIPGAPVLKLTALQSQRAIIPGAPPHPQHRHAQAQAQLVIGGIAP